MTPVEKVTELLKEAVSILRKQSADIDYIGRSGGEIDENEEYKRVHLLNVKKRLLDFYTDQLEFLTNQVEDDRGPFRFYLTQLRTQIELYGQLHYLSNLHPEDQLILTLADMLFTLAANVKGFNGDISDIQKKYTEYRSLYLFWFDEYSISMPENIRLLTKNEMRRQGLLMVPFEQKINQVEIENECPVSSSVWINLSSSIYGFYSRFSYYTHGNALMNQVHKNEKLWLIAKSVIYTSFFMELVNSKVTDNSRLEEFKTWIEKVSEIRGEFSEHWQSQV